MRSAKAFCSALVVAVFALPAADAVAANKCTRLAFSVNDYGKEGPTKDALQLLDKHIAQWATSYGVKKYTVGKKDVSCELFLDVILFDEYTCKASAAVCWTDGPPAPVANPEAEIAVKTPAAAPKKK
jgi:hypothetical protein